MQKLTLVVPDDLKREAKIKALREDKSLSQVVRELLRAWLGENTPEPGQEQRP